MEAILETKKLSHIYSAGTPFERGALLEVDFTAYAGEYLGIIGHTGSGKSTLIQHLNGLLKPTSGQVLFQGEDIWADAQAHSSDPVPGGAGVPIPGVPAL